MDNGKMESSCKLCGERVKSGTITRGLCKGCYYVAHKEGLTADTTEVEEEEILARIVSIALDRRDKRIRFKEMIKREKGWEEPPKDNHTCIICGVKVDKLRYHAICSCCNNYMLSQPQDQYPIYSRESIEKARNRGHHMRGKIVGKMCKCCGDTIQYRGGSRGLCKHCYNVARVRGYFSTISTKDKEEILKEIKLYREYLKTRKEEPCVVCGKLGVFGYGKEKVCYACIQRGDYRGIDWTSQEGQKKLKMLWEQKHKEIKCRNCGDKNIYAQGLCRECYLTALDGLRQQAMMSKSEAVERYLASEGLTGIKPNIECPIAEPVQDKLGEIKQVRDGIANGVRCEKCVICGKILKHHKVTHRVMCSSCHMRVFKLGVNVSNTLAVVEYFYRTGKLRDKDGNCVRNIEKENQCKVCGKQEEKMVKGLCIRCYRRAHKLGLTGKTSKIDEERILEKVKKKWLRKMLVDKRFKNWILHKKGWRQIPKGNKKCIVCGDTSEKLIRGCLCSTCYNSVYSAIVRK